MMAAVAARELSDGEVVFVGIGLPNLACNLARRTHAHSPVLVYEPGADGAVPQSVAALSPRTSPERVDFVTSPGQRVAKAITDKGVLERDEVSGELVLAALYPGVEAADVQAGVGWQLRCRPRLAPLDPPTPTELRLD